MKSVNRGPRNRWTVTRRSAFNAVLALAVASLTLAGTANGAAATPAETDDGACTITGTSGPDRLVGTPGDDVICGLGGNDVLVGGGGNDTLIGGPGNDDIRGNIGRDVLSGDGGRDSVHGGPGADAMSGGTGRDRLVAGTRGDACAEDAETVVGSCRIDRDGPTFEDITVPATVTAGETLVVTWRVTDPSGVGSPSSDPTTSAGSWIYLTGAPGWVLWCGFQVPVTVTGTTPTSAEFRAECLVPATAPNGEYGVRFNAIDSLFNSALFSDGRFTDDVTRTFMVTGGSDDASAPVVSEMTVTDSEVTPGGTVTIRWRATDESGVAYVVPWAFGPNGFLVDLATGELWMSSGEPTRISGDAQDGIYEVTVDISERAPAGLYTLWASAGDTIGNREFFTVDQGPDGAWGTFTIGG
jgi:hypothetical protein